MKIRIIIILCIVFLSGCGNENIEIINKKKTEVVSVDRKTTENIEDDTTFKEEKTDSNSKNIKIFVYICGQVKNPGVYSVESGNRIADVLKLAGGFLKKANVNAVNLAKVVEDGQQIIIPSIEDEIINNVDNGETTNKGLDDSCKLININTATDKELITLPGVGQSKADSIIEYRNTNGKFSCIEDIMKVTGIKEAAFLKIKKLITI